MAILKWFSASLNLDNFPRVLAKLKWMPASAGKISNASNAVDSASSCLPIIKIINYGYK